MAYIFFHWASGIHLKRYMKWSLSSDAKGGVQYIPWSKTQFVNIVQSSRKISFHLVYFIRTENYSFIENVTPGLPEPQAMTLAQSPWNKWRQG